MLTYTFQALYERLEKTDRKHFYLLEADFFLKFYYEIPREERPDDVVAFMTISNWSGFSRRSGVWTYYEVADPTDLEETIRYLQQHGDRELKEIFAYGIHDYQNPKYRENFNYPKNWITESEKIDDWIAAHETWLWEWERTLLLENRERICEGETKRDGTGIRE